MNFGRRAFRVTLALVLIVPGLSRDIQADEAKPNCIAEAERRVKQDQKVWVRTVEGSEVEGTFQPRTQGGPTVLVGTVGGGQSTGAQINMSDVTTLKFKRYFRVRPLWLAAGTIAGLLIGFLVSQGDSGSSSDDWLDMSAVEDVAYTGGGALAGLLAGLILSLVIPETVTLQCVDF